MRDDVFVPHTSLSFFFFFLTIGVAFWKKDQKEEVDVILMGCFEVVI